MKKFTSILLRVLLIMIGIWLIMAQGCMKFRISDNDAIEKFRKKSVELRSYYKKSNITTLHYVVTGIDTLPSIIFLHGSPGSWNAFENYLWDKDLLNKFRMIAIDRPGFGYSDFGKPQNLQQQTAIIGSVLNDFKNDKPVYIVGHSYGGPLAVSLVAANVDFFSGMILLAASVDPSEEPDEKWRRLFIHSPFGLFLPGAFRPSNAEIWYLKAELSALSSQFVKIKCKVVVVHGDKDNFVPFENAYYAERLLTHTSSTRLLILKGASHFIPWEPWYDSIKTELLKL
jgi:pimeloyl-ACP methyl ester carboxylesterase